MLHTSITIAANPAIQTPAQAIANKIISQNFVPWAPTTIKAVNIPKIARTKICTKSIPTICIAQANKPIFVPMLLGFCLEFIKHAQSPHAI